MASVKIILRSRANKKGEHPLILQIIKDRKKTIHSLGHAILKADWDAKAGRVKRSHPNHARLNNFLLKKLSEANDALLELQIQKKDTTVKAIKNTIVQERSNLFLAQAETYLNQLKKAGKYNRHNNDSPKIERIKEFAEGDIAFADITVSFLKKFQAWLKGTRDITDRTVANHLVVIRSIYNQAIENNLVDKKHYPFGKGKITIKFPDSKKVGLTQDEIIALEKVDLSNSHQNHARNLFLISFYFAGMRASDILRLQWSDFQNDRLYYTMGKNRKTDSLKVPAKAWSILQQYKEHDPLHDLVFPDLKSLPDLKNTYNTQRRIKTRVREANGQLEKIASQLGFTKKLTMHIARHSFAQIASDKISVQILQKLYRHSNITTTIGYQSNFTTKDMDSALDNVIG